MFRDALRPRKAKADEMPPQRPKRTRKRKEESFESFDITPPDDKPKRDRSSLNRSRESLVKPIFERASSLTTHRIVYQTDSSISPSKNDLGSEPLDDIVVVKPIRRKSRSSLRSQSLIPDEQNIMFAPIESTAPDLDKSKPQAPSRRKRFRRKQSSSLR